MIVVSAVVSAMASDGLLGPPWTLCGPRRREGDSLVQRQRAFTAAPSFFRRERCDGHVGLLCHFVNCAFAAAPSLFRRLLRALR